MTVHIVKGGGGGGGGRGGGQDWPILHTTKFFCCCIGQYVYIIMLLYRTSCIKPYFLRYRQLEEGEVTGRDIPLF